MTERYLEVQPVAGTDVGLVNFSTGSNRENSAGMLAFKPENIIRAAEPVKLVDEGLATLKDVKESKVIWRKDGVQSQDLESIIKPFEAIAESAEKNEIMTVSVEPQKTVLAKTAESLSVGVKGLVEKVRQTAEKCELGLFMFSQPLLEKVFNKGLFQEETGGEEVMGLAGLSFIFGTFGAGALGLVAGAYISEESDGCLGSLAAIGSGFLVFGAGMAATLFLPPYGGAVLGVAGTIALLHRSSECSY